MKKITAIVLSLCLLLAGVALADTEVKSNGGTGSTTVTYKVGEDVSFIVTIPAGISMTHDAGADVVTGQVTVSLDATNFNVVGHGITVALTESEHDFKLVNADGTKNVAYTVSKGDVKLEKDAKVIEWVYAAGGTKTDAATLDLSAAYDETLPAGEYTDTLTFTVTTTGN